MGIESGSSHNESIDKDWFPELKPLMFESFEYFVPDAESAAEQKSKFFNGEIDHPEFEFPKLKKDEIESKEASLLALKKSLSINLEERKLPIEKKSELELAKQVYHWRLNQMIAELRMLKASIDGNDKKFQRYSEFVYGKPETAIFDYIAGFTLEQIEKTDDNTEAKAAAEELRTLFSGESYSTEVSEPAPEVFETASTHEQEVVNDLVEMPEQEVLDADQVADGFEKALKKLQADGWCVVVDRESARSAISVNQSKQIVNVPGKIQLSKSRFCELVAHEIGTHVARRLKGERSKLMLLGLGLDRYDPGEEGVATMREQVFKGSAEGYTKQGLYLATSLAYGLDGPKRGFREVYDCLYKYNRFLFLSEGKGQEEAESKAKDTSWTQTVRVFRGSNGTAGVCYTKDLAYLEGNIGVWDVIEKNSNELHRFSVGKYNPANDRHIAVLDRLGISDRDLEELESEMTG